MRVVKELSNHYSRCNLELKDPRYKNKASLKTTKRHLEL